MFRKVTAALAIVIFAALSLTGCAGVKRVNGMFGKPLVYEKDGFFDDFGIRIDSGGTFTYSEGLLSSYVGCGFWELNGDVLILREVSDPRDVTSEVRRVNRFKVSDSGLVFLAEGSDNFIYIDVSDGEHFYIAGDMDNILI